MGENRAVMQARATLLERAFGVQPQERQLVLLFFAFFAGVGMFYTVGAAIGDTLFLSHVPGPAVPRLLPWVYVGIAVANGVSTLTFDAVQARVSRPVSIIGTQLVMAVSVLLARQLADAHATAVYFGLVIWLEACALFSITLFFSFAGDYFAPRDARRLYGLIVGGMPLGTIVAGYAIRVAVARVGTGNLLYAAAVVLVMNAVIAGVIFRVGKPIGSDADPMEASAGDAQVSLGALFERPYVRLLAALTMLSLVTYVTVDYQMKWLASALDEHALGRFFGTFYGWVGIAQLVFQLALSQRLLRRFGIITSLSVLPLLIGAASLASYAGSFVGYFGVGALALAASVNFVRVTLAETLDLPSRELLYLPLPQRLRLRLQPLLSGALAPISQGLGGLTMLLALSLGADVRAFALLAVSSATLLLLVLVRIRPRYRETLAATLRDHQLDATDLEQVMQSPSAEKLIDALLRANDPELVKATLELLAGRKLGGLSATLLELAGGANDEVAVTALQRLVQERDRRAPEAIDVAWSSESAARRQAAVLALCELDGRNAVSRVSLALSADDELMRSSAMIGLARFCGPDGQTLVRPQLEQLVASGSAAERQEAARMLGRIAATGFGDLWARLLGDHEASVRNVALEACAGTGDPLLAGLLLEGVAKPERRAASVRALSAMPRAAVPAVAEVLADAARSSAERCAVAQVLGQIGGVEAAEALYAHVGPAHELPLRLASAQALRALLERGRVDAVAATPGYDELVDRVCASIVLLRKAQSEVVARDEFVAGIFGDHAALELELLCALLSLRYERRTIDRIRYNLFEETPEVAQRALELFDELLPRRLAAPVVQAAQAWLEKTAPAEWLAAETQARLMVEDAWLRVATVHHLNQGAAYPTIGAATLSDADRDLYRLLDIVSFLKRVPLLGGLSSQYLREQAEVAEFRTLGDGETLFEQGDDGDALYIVCQGEIDVRIGDETIATLSAGACIGELALLDGEPRSAAALATGSDTLLLRLPAERFRSLLFSQPSTVRALLRTLDRRIRETQGGELAPPSAPPPGMRRSMLMRAQKLGLAELVSTMSFLRGVELFQDLSSDELANLAGIAQQVTLDEGDQLFEEGDPAESLYLVCSGGIAITVGERRVATLERNACLGEMALISGLPRSATATALASSRLLRIGADDFANLLAAEPSIAFALLRTLSRRLRDALAKRQT